MRDKRNFKTKNIGKLFATNVKIRFKEYKRLKYQIQISLNVYAKSQQKNVPKHLFMKKIIRFRLEMKTIKKIGSTENKREHI